MEVGRADQAAALLSEALATDPDNAWLLDALATAELEFDPEAALETSQHLLGVQPDSYRGQYLAGSACYQLGKVKQGVEHARLAVEAAPSSPAAHALFAEAASRQSRGRKRAAQAAQRAIELAPQSTLGYVAAGNVELHQGYARVAAVWYEKALAIDPSDRAASVNLTASRQAQSALAGAFKGARGLLALDPRDAEARKVFDETVYTTVVHLMWVTAVALFVLGVLRGV
jgi:tetratricopeptide (TPR) repeat protein